MAAQDPTVLALCGFGRAGKMHFTTLRNTHRCRLKYIVDIASQVKTIEDFIKEHGYQAKVVTTDEYEKTVLSDKEVKGIVVTTPTKIHEEYVCKAIEYGKGIFCEKPVAETLKSVTKCYEMAAKAGVPLLCAFNRRFDEAFTNAKEQVNTGALGKIHSIKSISRDSPLPSIEYLKVSSGFFHDSSVHDIDMICWIVGENPIELYAQGHAHDPRVASINDIDTAAIIMKFPSGVVGIIDQSRHSSYGYDQRVEVFGDNGYITVDNVIKTPVTVATKSGITQSPYVYSFPTRYAQAYRSEMMHFIDALTDPTIVLKVTKEDAERAVILADACVRSFENKSVEILK